MSPPTLKEDANEAKEEPKEEPKEPAELPSSGREPKEKVRKKRGPPKEPKIQCPICLRFYCGWRSQPGGHVCHPVKLPDPPAPAERYPPPQDKPKPEPPEPPHEPKSPVPVEPKLTHADVVRFMAREKRDRWHQQMSG